MQYKVIFLDWDGTLSESRFWERWSTDARNSIKYNLIQKLLFRDGQNLLHDWMCGRVSYQAVLKYMSKVTGITYKELADELRYSCENMKFIEENALGMVQKIRSSGVEVIIATDNMDVFRIWTISALKLDLLFDGILTSDTRGVMKSNVHADGTSLFFSQYFSQNVVRPEETVLIDNSLNNKSVEGFGMDFLHVSDRMPLSQHLVKLV